jgi:hypothetical protein
MLPKHSIPTNTPMEAIKCLGSTRYYDGKSPEWRVVEAAAAAAAAEAAAAVLVEVAVMAAGAAARAAAAVSLMAVLAAVA